MRELVKSLLSFSWATCLLAVRQMGALSDVDDPAGSDPAGSEASPPQAARHTARPVVQASQSRAPLVVMGEGLAAGMGDFSLHSGTQADTFGVQMARQMECEFGQPLFEPPGIGSPPGFRLMPVIVPAPFQTTVFEQLPPPPPSNLSVPGFTVRDAITVRPVQPMIHRENPRQTACNLILGAVAMATGVPGPLPTQLECAIARRPRLTIVALGYEEMLQAAFSGSLTECPATADMLEDFRRIVRELRTAGSEVLLLTIPDPLQTACFAAIDEAADVLRVPAAWIRETYGCRATDRLTVHGLNEIGFQLFANRIEPLSPRDTLPAEAAGKIEARLNEVNSGLAGLSAQEGVLYYDLCGLLRCFARQGLRTARRDITARYLGGFYGLNGMYPGAAGHALIANELLAFLNMALECAYPPIDVDAVIARDAVANYQPAGGELWSRNDLDRIASSRTSAAIPEPRPIPAFRSSSQASPSVSLRLPDGLEQILPLNISASYFGDGISPLHCTSPRDVQWGSCANFLFGGLAMVDSHLGGFIRIRFSPPVEGQSRFEISFTDGFAGEDSTLECPQYFRMAFRRNRVDDVAGNVSSGVLHLATGEVTELKVFAQYSSTALGALVGINPTFPRQPLSFPGQYGSAWARFEARADGKLDFSFYGSTFVPLGDGIRWPLNFTGRDQRFASVPASGTAMHPHLCLSTKVTEPGDVAGSHATGMPFNSIREMTLHTHNSSFGDGFTLNAPELGGPAKGRSHVLGRLWVQFGPRCGNSVPVAVLGMKPGGLFFPMEESPITQAFPGRLSPGPQGFYEQLRFPQRTYSLDDLAILSDPFDIPVGLMDLRSGSFIADLLHRGFIHQDLIFALLRVEPRTPKDSFYFRGPASVEQNGEGQLVFRQRGVVGIPYPEGFLFPQPNFAMGYVVGPDSRLDPFLWLRAVTDRPARGVIRGEAREVTASTGDRFSYRYTLSADSAPEPPVFEYTNHSQGGSFTMHTISWLGFSSSAEAAAREGEPDTVTFSGFGVWSKDGKESLQQAAVQITRSSMAYVGIQIGEAAVSNVNTKPVNEKDALP